MNLILEDIEPELNISEKRVIEYANNRIEANPEDNFNKVNSIDEAIKIINIYGEIVLKRDIGEKVFLAPNAISSLQFSYKENNFENDFKSFIIEDIIDENYILKEENKNVILSKNSNEYCLFKDEDFLN